MNIDDPDGLDATPAAGMRSLYERMINPTPTDQGEYVTARLATLSYVEIDRVVGQFAMLFEHLAAQRDDLDVTQTRDEHGWTIRVDIKPVTQSVVSFNSNADH